MCVWILLLLLAGNIWAQSPADGIRAAMEASLSKQRASVKTQVASISSRERTSRSEAGVPAAAAQPTLDPAAAPEFYTVPWPKPVSMLSASCEPLPGSIIDELIAKTSTREGMEPDILRQVMSRESAFRPCAVSVKGAQGLMQLMPATALQFGVRDPFDPEQNAGAGAKFLKQLLGRYNGDLGLALAAYNAGPGNVDKAGGIPDNAETKAYVSELLKRILL